MINKNNLEFTKSQFVGTKGRFCYADFIRLNTKDPSLHANAKIIRNKKLLQNFCPAQRKSAKPVLHWGKIVNFQLN